MVEGMGDMINVFLSCWLIYIYHIFCRERVHYIKQVFEKIFIT